MQGVNVLYPTGFIIPKYKGMKNMVKIKSF